MDIRNGLTGLVIGLALGIQSTAQADHEANTEIIFENPQIRSYTSIKRSCDGANASHPACQYPKSFTITPITGLTAAAALNGEGQIAGVTVGVDREGEQDVRRFHAGLWRNGEVTDLGMLGCRTSVSICQSGAKALNIHGHVVGESSNDYVSPYYLHAFVWRNGAMTALPEPGSEWSSATGINDSGNMVGYGRYVVDYLEHGWININNHLIIVGGEGQNSRANAINNRNVAAGAINVGGTAYAFRWENNVIRLAGTFGSMGSHAYDLNNKWQPQVVGSSRNNDGFLRGFLWQRGMMYDLDILPEAVDSIAKGINNRGQIVGTSGGRGVIWQNGEIRDLNMMLAGVPQNPPPGAIVTDAIDIDWRGRILAVGENGANYLLTPNY